MSDNVSSLLNLTGAKLRDCTLDAASASSLSANNMQYNSCTVIDLSGETLPVHFSGRVDNLVILNCEGGSIVFDDNSVVNGLDIRGQRLNVKFGDNVQCKNIEAQDTCFVSFECANNVVISHGNFENAMFSYCELNGENVTFDHCRFDGAHLNPSFAGATLISCSMDANTRATYADLEACSRIVDLRYRDENGESKYVQNTSELTHIGVGAGLDCEISPAAQIQTAMASVSGGQDCAEASFQANLPNEAQKSGPDQSVSGGRYS